MHWYGIVIYSVSAICFLTAIVIGLKSYRFYKDN